MRKKGLEGLEGMGFQGCGTRNLKKHIGPEMNLGSDRDMSSR